jgi:hypothetical protein
LGNKGGRKTRGSFVIAPPHEPSSSSLEGHTKASLFAEKRKKSAHNTHTTKRTKVNSSPSSHD